MTVKEHRGKLKVLFIPAWYPSESDPVSGIFIKEHARAASLYNDIVVLYAYSDPSPQFKGLYRFSEEMEDGIRTIRVKYGGILKYLWGQAIVKKREPETAIVSKSRGNILSRLLRGPQLLANGMLYFWSISVFFRKLLNEGWRPHVIHAHEFTAGTAAVLLHKLYHIPVVITERWSGFPLGRLTLFSRTFARYAMNRAQCIVPTSNYMKSHIEKYGIRNSFVVIPNVVNTEIFYPPPPQINTGEGKKERSKNILIATILKHEKGVTYLLEALSQIRQRRQDFSLDIVGDGPDRREFEEQSLKLGLAGIVNFHGLKRKEEVAQFMRNCDFFVQPSLQETFGVVYIEAMACGKPVIATDAGGPNETVTKEAGIFVPYKDVRALTAAIEYMLDNYAGYSPDTISRRVQEMYSYRAVGKMLDDVYAGVRSPG